MIEDFLERKYFNFNYFEKMNGDMGICGRCEIYKIV
jgi:hypothetical protein